MSMRAKVINVIDGDTFDVSPSWRWNNETGNRVRPTGFDAPEIGTQAGEAAKRRLSQLILHRDVELGKAYKVDRGRLVCDVSLDGKELSSYFPKY